MLAHSDDSPAVFTATETLSGPARRSGSGPYAGGALRRDHVRRGRDSPSTLNYLADAAAEGAVDVQPTPAAMLILQDKLRQKEWLTETGLPTAPFHGVEGEPDPVVISGFFGLPFVQKARRGGYDGRGVQIIRTEADLAELWDGGTLIEPFVDNIRELAVVAARSTSGEIACFEVTELTFDPAAQSARHGHHACTHQHGPSRASPRHRHPNAGGAWQRRRVFAIELFLTEDDDLLVNEISPRVHNTGHHTLESSGDLSVRPASAGDQRPTAGLNPSQSTGRHAQPGLAGRTRCNPLGHRLPLPGNRGRHLRPLVW